MGMKLNTVLLCIGLCMAGNSLASEVCTVSMMGRVCYQEGSPELTAAHMKGDAALDANLKKGKSEAVETTRLADAKKK